MASRAYRNHCGAMEMRPTRMTPRAQNARSCAQACMLNSFRSDDHEHNAVGLIHREMRQLDYSNYA